MRKSSQNPHNLARNSALEAPPPAPPNETPEERIKRILNSMPEAVADDPKRVLKALRLAVREIEGMR